MKIERIIVISIIIILVGAIIFAGKPEPPAYAPIYLNTGSTTDATPTTLATFSLATGQTIRITVDLLATSGNNRLRGVKSATIKNISGTLSIVGATVADVIATVEDAPLITASFTITTSGTNVIIQVTGVAATNISWFSNTEIYIN